MEGEIPGEQVKPETIVEAALASGAPSIAYTYTEPTILFGLIGYAMDAVLTVG